MWRKEGRRRCPKSKSRSEGEKAGKRAFPLLYGSEYRFVMKAVARKETQERGEEKAVGVVNG